MYCPECLNYSLEIAERGVINVVVNGKMRDNGRFFFNQDEDSEDDIAENAYAKLEDFFKWYSNFQNKDPEHLVVISTRDFNCKKHCTLPPTFHVSVIDILISKSKVQKMVERISDKFELKVEIKAFEQQPPPRLKR